LVTGDGERASLLTKLARRAFPSLEFFIFSLLCGAVLGAGYLFNSQGLILFGVLLAPLLMPWIGMTLAATCGTLRFFLQTSIGLVLGCILVFVPGLLAGLAANLWQPSYSQAILHSRIWWADILVLVIAAVLLIISFIRSEERPILPSVMLAYELLPPLSAAAFGLGYGLENVWPEGLLVFLFHLGTATLLGMIMLFILRFRPGKPAGYLLTLSIGLLSVILVIALSGLGAMILRIPSSASLPIETPTTLQLPTITATPILPTAQTASSSTGTSVIAGNLSTMGTSQVYAATETPTLQPTAIYGLVDASPDYEGANLRDAPGYEGTIITSLPNGALVQVLPETETIGFTIWVHVYSPTVDRDGWMLQSVVIVTTPTPNN
jgi:uncharacterized membrane protein